MAEFTNAVDIANRAAQHLGVPRISSTDGFTEDSKAASAFSFCYGKLRRAELRRNVWRFSIKTAAMRPIDTTTMFLTPSLWSAQTTYYVGSIVVDDSGRYWISNTPDNLDNDPQNTAMWDLYTGPLSVQVYDSTIGYYAGELVYAFDGDGTYTVYLSLLNDNDEDPATADTWDATVTYMKDQIVTLNSVTYMSLIDLNLNQSPDAAPALWAVATTYASGAQVGGSDGVIYTSVGSGNIGHDPTTDGGVHWTDTGVLNPWTTENLAGTGSLKWLKVTDAVLSELKFPYPIGSGPSSQSSTRNVYRLPANYLRAAPQDPKAGSISYLGAPSGLSYSDWQFEGQFIVTSEANVILFRFAADITDVAQMDDMFCEGLAARLALATCEELTQSTAKKQAIASEYQKFMTEAREINAIEQGAIEPEVDDWIECRA